MNESIKVVIEDLVSSFKDESGERKINRLKVQAEIQASVLKPWSAEDYNQLKLRDNYKIISKEEYKVILANAKLQHKRTHPGFKFHKKLIRFEDLKHFIK